MKKLENQDAVIMSREEGLEIAHMIAHMVEVCKERDRYRKALEEIAAARPCCPTPDTLCEGCVDAIAIANEAIKEGGDE